MSPAQENGEVRIQVKNLFATPVALLQVPDCAPLNSALKARILDKEAGARDGTQHSNLGGWQSAWDMATWGGAETQTILDLARSAAGQLTRDRQGNQVALDWKINCWANINRSGHANEFHTHPGAFWSGTYYVDDGQNKDDRDGESGEHVAQNVGGEFEIQDPRGVAPVMYAPLLTFAGPGGASLGATEMIAPKAGLMVLFPAWLSHAVRPYRGKATRISIAFNLSL